MSTTGDAAADAAAVQAAQEAFRRTTIEIWTLYGVAVASTVLRTYARVRAVGWKGLAADDYLVWVGVFFYTAQSSLGYSIGNLAQGMANNGMLEEQRRTLPAGSPEYHMRVLGSQIQVAGWTVYSMLIWALKLSMLTFYTRLTSGLGRPFRIRINIGFALVLSTFVAALLSIFTACRPFDRYWQINPNPGNSCQAAVSKPIIWVSFAANVSTDIYLIMIPLPMLWQSTLRTPKKIASSIVLGAGIFVLVCALLKSIFVIVDPVDGAQLAGSWGIREAFTAVIVTNLPMIFPLFKVWLKPWFGSALGSSKKVYDYKSSPGFRTIGGGGGSGGQGSGSGAGYSGKQHRRGLGSSAISETMTFNDSQENIVDDVKMEDIRASVSQMSKEHHPESGIMVSNEVRVTREDRSSHGGPGHITATCGETYHAL